MYRLWSEWDIGEGNKIFATPEAGMAWLRANQTVAEMAEEDKQSIDECIAECFSDGYFCWESVEIIQ